MFNQFISRPATISEIAFIESPTRQEYEGMNLNFSPIIKSKEFDTEICTDLEDRELVPYKFDEISSRKDSHANKLHLFDLGFIEESSPDRSITSADVRLFGQLHRLQDNFSLCKTEKPEFYALSDAASRQQVFHFEDNTPGKVNNGQKNLDDLVPILYCRKPLPLLNSEETPVYVNSKQYERILILRNKKQQKGMIKGPNHIFERPKSKPYSYESRSQHAKKRQREGNGRFVAKSSSDIAEIQEIVCDKSQLCPKIKRRDT